jgi:3-dehydroquinate dehydratase
MPKIYVRCDNKMCKHHKVSDDTCACKDLVVLSHHEFEETWPPCHEFLACMSFSMKEKQNAGVRVTKK